MDLGLRIVQLENRVKAMERQARLGSASLDDTALLVRDGDGGLRGVLGQQGDGTTAVNIVNGPPPPQPSAPLIASVLGGVTVSWDGKFADGAVIPMDWSRVEVHAAPGSDFTPTAETLQSTIETAQGSTVVVPTDVAVYVRLMARSTSGTASVPSVQAGPLGPAAVVATDILDGIVTEVKLAAGAVTAAKIAVGAVGTTALGDGAVLSEKLADAAVKVGKLANSAVTSDALATDSVTVGKIAADVISARELKAASVTASELSAGSVTAAAIAAGTITAEKLTIVGGSNVLPDPGFEGAGGAAVAAKAVFLSQDKTFGNGSPSSLKIDATSTTSAFRAAELTLLPVTPGDQLYLAGDYFASLTWVGTEASIHARWEKADGTVISYSKAVASPVPLGAWGRLTGTVTAPALAVQARVRVESGAATAGSLWFDNCEVRPVVPGVQIADGAITTPKIVAGAILAGQIAAGAVLTDKLAAEAVTAAKIAALAITTAKLDANAVTTGKLAAGSVDATSLKADAITGKTITGGIINGAEFHSDDGLGGTVDIESGSVVVSDSTREVAALDSAGLKLTGIAGAVLSLDPNNQYPVMRMTNAGGTNSAFINVVENTPGSANLGLNAGTFAGSGFADMRWRTFFGEDFWIAERFRASGPTTTVGGRIDLRNNYASIGYTDTTGATQPADVVFTPGLASVHGRLRVLSAEGDANTLFLVQSAAGHTGYLARMFNADEGAYKFSVEADGSTSIGGTLTVGSTPGATYTPVLGGLNNSPTYATREGWYYKIGKMVFVTIFIDMNSAAAGTATLTVSLPSIPSRVAGNRRQLLTCYGEGIAAGANSSVPGNFSALMFSGATGAIIDQFRGPTNQILLGTNLGTGSLAIQGWYREE